MEIVSKEEREFFTELYGSDLTDSEIDKMMSSLTEYFKLLIEAKRGLSDANCQQ